MDVRRAARISASVGFLIYLNSLGLQFCFDDEIAIIRNQDVRTNTSWSTLLYDDFWGQPMSSPESHKSYRPLTVATFRLNYMVHELQPLGYHLVNVLLHSAVCYLYVLLCGVVFSEVWPALIAGLLFAVHPIHTEAVSGVVARADTLSALFLLLAVLSYSAKLSSAAKLHRWGHLLLSLLLILCSALSKEIGITAVAICLVYELLIHRKLNVGDVLKALKSHPLPSWLTRLLFSSLIFGLFTLLFLVFRVLLNQGTPKITYSEVNPAVEFPTPLRQLHWSYLCVLNVWLLLSPSQLCAEYAMGTIPPIASLTDPRNLLTLATFAGLLSVGCYAASTRDSHHRKLLFGVCLMVIPFIPASNLFFPVGFVIAERVLYIPSMGFSMIVAYGAWLLISNKNFKSATKIVLLYLLCLHGIKTFTRSQDWTNNLTLFSSALRIGSKDLIILDNLAVTLQEKGSPALAEAVLKHSIDNIDPLYISSHMKLAHLLKEQARFQEAILAYEQAEKLITRSLSNKIDIPSGSSRVYIQLASMLLKHTQDYERAYKLTRNAVQVEPEWEEPHKLMGKCLMKLEKFSDAVTAFKKALELKEDFAEVYASLGEAHLELGELEEAEMYLLHASELNSQDFLSQFKLVKLILDHTAAHTTSRLTEALNIALKLHDKQPANGNVTLSLASLYTELGDLSQALTYMEKAVATSPHDIHLLILLSQAYHEANRYVEAKAPLYKYLELSPNDTRALYRLGTINMMLKEYTEARTHLEAVVTASPDDESAQVNYGLSLIHTKENREALEVFQKLARDFPENPSYTQQVAFIKKIVDS